MCVGGGGGGNLRICSTFECVGTKVSLHVVADNFSWKAGYYLLQHQGAVSIIVNSTQPITRWSRLMSAYTGKSALNLSLC